MLMNRFKDIVQNYMLGARWARSLARRFHNTGGGRVGSKAHNKRIAGQLSAVESILAISPEISKEIRLLEVGYGKKACLLESLAKRSDVISCIGYEPEGICSEDGKVRLVNDPSMITDIDLAYSFDVFEHLKNPRCVISTIKQTCKKNALVFAKIDLVSHYHRRDSVSAFDHYKYSDRTWNMMTWNRSGYTNRIRAHEWKKIFEEDMDLIFFKEENHSLTEVIMKEKELDERDCVESIHVLGRLR